MFPALLIFHSNGLLHTMPCMWLGIVWGIPIINQCIIIIIIIINITKPIIAIKLLIMIIRNIPIRSY